MYRSENAEMRVMKLLGEKGGNLTEREIVKGSKGACSWNAHF